MNMRRKFSKENGRRRRRRRRLEKRVASQLSDKRLVTCCMSLWVKELLATDWLAWLSGCSHVPCFLNPHCKQSRQQDYCWWCGSRKQPPKTGMGPGLRLGTRSSPTSLYNAIVA